MRIIPVIILTGFILIFSHAHSGAMEHRFGGEWEMKAFTMQNFTGNDQDKDTDLTRTESTTTLVYTALITDHLKFVNQFELSAVWGDTESFGRMGADGVGVSVINSYADFDIGSVNFRIGVQGWELARGFMFDDDFAGAVVTYKADDFEVPFVWIKAREEDKDEDDGDLDYYAAAPLFEINDMITLNPYIFYVTSSDAGETGFDTAEKDNLDAYYIGLDLDLEYDPYALWFTGLWLGGKIDRDAGGHKDISSWLTAIGGNINFECWDIHGQFFFATGQKEDEDEDIKAFIGPEGCAYTWSEIMGEGEFDEDVSANSPGTEISDIMAANIGTTLIPAEDITLSLDLWYAELAEKGDGEDYLGTEIDVTLTYQLVDGLDLEVIGAYMFPGDATYKGDNKADPFEFGMKLSFEF